MTGRPYSHLRALKTYVKASLTALSRNLSTMIFGFLFPIIFIVIFGLMGDRSVSMDVGVTSNSDRHNELIERLERLSSVRLIRDQDDRMLVDKLKKGELEAIVEIRKNSEALGHPYTVHVTTSDAAAHFATFEVMLKGLMAESRMAGNPVSPAEISLERIEGRPYRAIDFILPGQLGFVIISSGVFGAAYVLITLKQRLIIKRLLVTPVRPITILLGESISRLIFSLMQVTLIVILGVLLFGFTLIHGFVTLLPMLLVCALGLLIFFGFGMIVSQLAKNEHAVPPISNLFVLPQALLSGTFFSTNVFPDWLQNLSRLLPLTPINDALRKISFEGAGLTDIGAEMAALAVWGVIVYAINVRIFRWD